MCRLIYTFHEHLTILENIIDIFFKKFLVVGAYAWREERLAAFFRKVEDEVEEV
jgi:hypothetical protein